jgi:AraC family transcriptional regulator of adaptative response / DNA-3-methyladenine glycosylase II
MRVRYPLVVVGGVRESEPVLDDDICYRAVSSRDARFDGMFLTGVTTTGIYCRPSCPARTPNRENVRFFRSAAEAQSAGLRACRRCRPDVSPGSPEWNVRADLAGRAMRLIADGVVDRDGVEGLAARLGYSVRQVHRTLLDEVGAGPLRLARTQRAHAARILLETTPLPVTEIAYAAGFASIRQLNATVREVYDCTPTQLRAGAGGTRAARARARAQTGRVDLRLAYRQPADLTGLLAFFRAHAVPGVEEVDGSTYRRSVRLPHGYGVVELTPRHDYVHAVLHLSQARDLGAAVARCRRLFDLDADPVAIDAVLRADRLLAAGVAATPGIRLPGTIDGAEQAIRTIVGQQVSVAGANTVCARLVAEYGDPLPTPLAGITHLFPSAERLATVDPAALPMPRSRGETVVEVSRRIAVDAIDLEPGADRAATVAALLALKGIGPWSVGYLRMRALGDPDVVLPTDLAIRDGFARNGLPSDPASIVAHAERWRPWRSYALMHVWRLARPALLDADRSDSHPSGAAPTDSDQLPSQTLLDVSAVLT